MVNFYFELGSSDWIILVLGLINMRNSIMSNSSIGQEVRSKIRMEKYLI